MATLITGHRSLRSLVGVTVHEMAHSWFQALLATNESLYEYMDEGMTSYATELCMRHLFVGPGSDEPPHQGAFSSYISQALSGNEEPLIHPRRPLPDQPRLRCRSVFERGNPAGPIGRRDGR